MKFPLSTAAMAALVAIVALPSRAASPSVTTNQPAADYSHDQNDPVLTRLKQRAAADMAENLREKQLSQLQAFAKAKQKQAQALAARGGGELPPAFQRFFNSAIKGEWSLMTNRFEALKTPGFFGLVPDGGQPPHTNYWSPVVEIYMAWEQVAHGEPKYTQLFIDDVLKAVPAGSIYFGGTDPGRGLPTAFCKSHADGDPFFTLTQNALADGTYLDYLRLMYGAKLQVPSDEDSQKCFLDYSVDVSRRLKHDQEFPNEPRQLRPGENVHQASDGRVTISGQVSVMMINALFARIIFDRNTNREFFVEESFPLDWMYPYLEPRGPIMKLNRQPLTRLSSETIAQDQAYWRKLVTGALGDWLDDKTSVSNLVEFVDRVYLREDLQGFTGDPRYVQGSESPKLISKLRTSVAGLYAWRASPTCPPEYEPKSDAERQLLLKEAELAFKQAYTLCPYNPETLYRYANLLIESRRFDDALLLAQTSLKLDPKNSSIPQLLENIKASARWFNQQKPPASTASPATRP